MQTITEVMVKALEAPLRAQVEACIQAIVAEAAKDIHARIAVAVGQIQPINIPVNLFAQPALQPIQPPAPQPVAVPVAVAVAPPVIPEPAPETAPAPIVQIQAPIPQTSQAPEPESRPEPEPAPEPKPTPAPKLAPAPAAVARKFLNVTVVGLKPGQAHMIKSEFKFIKLHFITSDAGAGKQLKSLAKTNDYVVQMVDFIRHSVGDSLKSVSANWICISGGMTKLRDKLEELNNNHKDACPA
jgi:hypothetical protein